jgi:hypothetical protein
MPAVVSPIKSIEWGFVGKRLLVLVMVVVSCISSSVSVANAVGNVASDSLSVAVSAVSALPTATTSTTVPAKTVKTVKPVKPVKPVKTTVPVKTNNKNVTIAVSTTVPVITVGANITTGTSGSSGSNVAAVLPVEIAGLISVCVNKSTSVLRDTADNSCSSGNEIKVEWLDTGMSPKICVNNNNREMTLAQDGKCPTKNSAVADVTVNKQILACADDKTDVLRYRASGVCGVKTDPVAWVLKDQGVARNITDAVKTVGIQTISLVNFATTNMPTNSATTNTTINTATTTATTATATTPTATTTTATTITTTTTAVPTATTSTSTSTTTTIVANASGSLAGYFGGTCPDGSGIPWYWGTDGTARAGGCSAAASIAPTTTTPETTTTAVSATTVAPVVVPGTPATPTGVSGNAQVTVTVSAGTGGTPTSYTITKSTTSGGTYSTGCTVTGASGSCVVTGLTNDTTYFFKTTATNTAGTSSLSTASASVTPAIVPGTPATPTGVSGNAQVTVSVTAGTGGTPTSYTVTQSTASGGAYTTGCTVTVPASSCVVTGLTNDTPYFFKTTATNSVGTSGLSVASTSVTPATIYVVGNTGPGGGLVFYVQASGGTFPCGVTLASTCKYLEAAPTSGTAAWTDAQYKWSGNVTTAVGANAQGVVVGTGLKNTEAMVLNDATASKAGTIARAYRGPNTLTDWYLPSKDELNQMCKWNRGVAWGSDAFVCTGGTLNSATYGASTSGFTANNYWSSSEFGTTTANGQQFNAGNNGSIGKDFTGVYARPIRAFG